jgi:ubiquinone/menaquinone biosynthesis C-methylase UbiE
MVYYDRIAHLWHRETGVHGGAFKRHVLNVELMQCFDHIAGISILELGAGNGYLMPLVMERYSGQVPEEVWITDASESLLEIAQRNNWIANARYNVLDIRYKFPFEDERFDLIIASMVLNEIGNRGLQTAVQEAYRVLRRRGRLVIAITHPGFVSDLKKRGEIVREKNGVLTMPGAGRLRLPIAIRSVDQYRKVIFEAGFEFLEKELHATQQVRNEKPGLKKVKDVPIALVFNCEKVCFLSE